MPYDVEVYHRKADMLAPPELAKVHPLGKSPVVTVTAPDSTQSVVLAESGFIFQYLCDHFAQGKSLVPRRWKDGQENKVLGETEAWMRYQYLLNYVEGSLMPNLVMFLVLSGKYLFPCVESLYLLYTIILMFLTALKGKQVPFIVRPISSVIANQVTAMMVFPNMKKHLGFLEQQLETSGGDFITGPDMTAADILLSYPLLAGSTGFDSMGKWPKGTAKESYPKLFAYMERLEQQPGYKKAVEKTKEIDGGKFSLVPTPP